MQISMEIAHLMRTGTKEEIQAFFQKNRLFNTDTDFYSYINGIVDRSPYNRSEIAQRAGLSRDYTYKLLRGDKRTSERDYILALCLALQMDVQETQEALRLYPFPILQDTIPRSAVIKAGIMYKIGLDMMNEWLDRASFPLIRTSPEMPSSKLREKEDFSGFQSTMKIMNKSFRVDTSGEAPYKCSAEALLMDEDESSVYITIEDALYLSNTSIIGQKDKSFVSKKYPNLPSAINSPFFIHFLEMSIQLDQRIAASINEGK